MLSLQVSQLLQPPTLPETAAAAGSDATGIPLRWRSMEGGVAWFPLGKLWRFHVEFPDDLWMYMVSPPHVSG